MSSSNINESIFDRVKHVIPDAAGIAKAMEVEHETAERLRRLAVLDYAAKMEASEIANQAMTDSADFVNAISTLVTNQNINMESVERFMDQQAGATTIVQNILEVFVRFDAPTIAHALTVVELTKVTEAARSLPISRIAGLVDALLSATEGSK